MIPPDLRRVLDRIQRLSRQGRDVASFFDEASALLIHAVPSGMEHGDDPCWYTVDPASLLVTSVVGGGECEMSVADLMRFEYLDDDVNKVSEVFSNRRGVQTLHEVTDGDPHRSAAFRSHSYRVGIGSEALLALRTRKGQNWGAVRLVRGQDQPEFSRLELEFLRAASPYLAAGALRGLLIGQAQDPDSGMAPGMIVINPDLTISSITPAAERLLAELSGWEAGGELPTAVLAVASRVAHSPSAEDPANVGVRVQAESGIWMTLHASELPSLGEGMVGVIVELAHPARVAPLLMELYELTEREKDVTRLVLRGFSAKEIAARLFMSEYTVQQHLKSVFSKTSARSRRELVSTVFYDAYEPRVSDNNERRLVDLPIRGGPLTRRDGTSPL